ncbi:MAG: S-layer homology domain-containing protein, partial [Clostridia bacterium]|nr:S-layer homology domain-containing protein [Clostridia bacterium]
VPETEDGDVTVDKETPAAGEKVTITVTPDSGKEVGEVIVKDENGNKLPVTKNEDGTYTYEQPDGDVTVEVEFKDSEYEVKVPETEEGDVEVDNETPKKGDKVTITVTPEPGKEVEDVIVKDENGNKLPVTENKDGTYSYEQPAGDVTIEVIFREESRDNGFDRDAWYRAVMMLRRKQALEEAAKAEKTEEIPEAETSWQNPFKDVAETDWFYEDVEFVNETGLMIGTNTAGTKFSPEDTLTRAMLVTILWRLESEPVVNYLMQFNDVPAEEWYTEAVRWAAAEGIVNGYGDDTFGPMNAVTREQAMAILHRYAAYKGLENGMIFPMIPQYDYSLWAENDILWADMIGLTSGIGKDIFDMTASADRAEIAAYLRRFCEAFMEE